MSVKTWKDFSLFLCLMNYSSNTIPTVAIVVFTLFLFLTVSTSLETGFADGK